MTPICTVRYKPCIIPIIPMVSFFFTIPSDFNGNSRSNMNNDSNNTDTDNNNQNSIALTLAAAGSQIACSGFDFRLGRAESHLGYPSKLLEGGYIGIV